MRLDMILFPGVPAPLIEPAEAGADWMDATPERFAHRCLPMTRAQRYGWAVRAPRTVVASWDGTPSPSGMFVQYLDAGGIEAPVSLFGHGVLTWHVGALFRTEPGWDLWMTGPPNVTKRGIVPLTGCVETDWLPDGTPFEATMNWRVTEPRHPVRFDRGEPYLHLFPVLRDAVRSCQPRVLRLGDVPGLASQHAAWVAERNAFHADIRVNGARRGSEGWSRRYFSGIDMDGARGLPDHRIAERAPPFACPSPNTALPPEGDG